MLTLYYAPRTISVAVAIALNEAKVDYARVKIDFANAEQTKASFLTVNPKGRVPAVKTKLGTLTETGAILEYVAPALVPDEPFDAAQMRELMFYLASTMHVAHAHGLRGSRWAKQQSSLEDMAQMVPQTMATCARYLETHLACSPYAIGAEFTVADAYLYVVLTWLQGDGVDVADFPKLAAFKDMMDARACVQQAKKEGML